MKSLIVILLSSLAIGCASTSSGEYRYCSAANVASPYWYTKIKDEHVVAKFGVKHTREAERDVMRMSQIMLAHQLYSRVSGSTTIVNGELDRASQYSKVASNVYLDSAKVEWDVNNGCMVVWAGVTTDAADRSLEASLAINEQERQDWRGVHNTYSIALLEKHIKQYPLGIYRETAEQRIASLHKGNRKDRIRDSRLHPGAKLLLNLSNSI